METVNLKKILMSTSWKEPLTEAEFNVAFRTGLYKLEHILEAMQTACLQTVDLCLDSVELEHEYDEENNRPIYYINLESILKVKGKIINEST